MNNLFEFLQKFLIKKVTKKKEKSTQFLWL